MKRDEMLLRLRGRDRPWDLIVVGGGATGAGVALDAAARGYEVALVEGADFGSGTSSRSTKLVHGGVRYLRQGNIPLVMDALRERGILRANAPHLVHDLAFVVPHYDWWEAPFYGVGLKVYDALAGRYGFGPSRLLSVEETVERLPTIETGGLRGGVIYHDGQFDDARLLIHLMRTAADHGATVLNYARVEGLLKDPHGMVSGVRAVESESGDTLELEGRVVVNATGAFSDELRRFDDADSVGMIRPSQGIHLVLAREFLPGDAAIMVPKTDDGRVLFAVPWHDRVLVGTTDTPVDRVELEPRALPEEVDFVLRHAAQYLTRDPGPGDVLSVFAGLRPLVAAGGGEDDTSALSRDHTLQISRSGLVTIAGGKWTTYRKMAEDTVDHAATLAGLKEVPSPTVDLPVHGHWPDESSEGHLSVHGSDAPAVRELAGQPGLGARLHPRLPTLAAEIVWAARHEMARTVDDALSRRTRGLLLDARAAIEAAPAAARLMAGELDRDGTWEADQVESFRTIARGYLV